MTLLIFARCQDGCILASDRKATRMSGESQEETKCRSFPSGVAVAGAGSDGLAIQALFGRLDRDGVNVQDAENVITGILRGYNQTSTIGVECIVLAPRNHTVEAVRVRTSQYDTFSHLIVQPHYCAGEEGPKFVATHYLKKKDYATLPLEEATPEILAILNMAAREGSFVGSQQDYGFDVALVRPNESCYIPRLTTALATVNPTEYTPVLNAPNFEFVAFMEENSSD